MGPEIVLFCFSAVVKCKKSFLVFWPYRNRRWDQIWLPGGRLLTPAEPLAVIVLSSNKGNGNEGFF